VKGIGNEEDGVEVRREEERRTKGEQSIVFRVQIIAGHWPFPSFFL